MRVLVFNQYYPPDTSNTARLLADFLEHLALTHEVEVVAGTPSYQPDDQRTTAADGAVRVTRVPSLTLGRGSMISRALTYLSYLGLSLLRGVALRRPDVVVALTDPPVIGAVGAVVALRYRRPMVFVSHDVHPDIGLAMGLLTEGPAVRAWRAVNAFIRARAQRIVVVGRDMGDRLREQGVPAEKLSYVPTWGSGEALDDAARAEARARLGWTERFVVMHAGNMGLAQNLPLLLDVAERLRDDPAIGIVFLGDGPSREALAAEAKERGLHNVEFLAQRPRAEAQALMSAADLHVVSLIPGLRGCAAPSKTYGVMAAGRPFVAAVDDGAEPGRIAAEWACGEWVPPADPSALAAAVVRMRASPLDEMGRRARAGFEAQFTCGRCVAELQSIVEQAAAVGMGDR